MSEDFNNGTSPGNPSGEEVGYQPNHRGWQGEMFPEPTFRQVVDWYVARVRNPNKSKSRIMVENSIISHALEWLEMRRIKRPTTADWKEYFDWRMSPECSLAGGKAGRITARTADAHRAVLHMIYRGCRNIPNTEWHHVPDPLDAGVLPRCHSGHRDEPRALAEPYVTYPRLLMAMPDVLAKAFISLMRWHGLRLQEALGIPLPGSNVDRYLGGRVLNLQENTLLIARQRTRDQGMIHEPLKTEYSKARIKLAPEPAQLVREALRWRAQQAGAPGQHPRKLNGECARNYVFPYFRCHLDGLMDIHRQVSPLDFRVRVRGVEGGDAWHVYRHTFAAEHYKRVLEGKLPKEELHRMLRHKDPKTTDRYLTAFTIEVLGSSEAVEESWRIQMQMQEQAIRERSGQGPTLVPEPPLPRERARPQKRQHLNEQDEEG